MPQLKSIMFKRKKCDNCGEGIKDKYEFCPACGIPLTEDARMAVEEDWGMLGKTDQEYEEDPFASPLFGGITGNMLGKMLGGAMKLLEKELQKEMSRTPQPGRNFELYINGKKVDPKKIKVTQQVQPQQAIPTKNEFSKENLKKLSTLPRKEPETKMKRFSDKLIYEVYLPGVNSFEDILVNKLESSIEIKAVSKENSYSKIIPISLPIIGTKFSKGKLVLELENGN